MPTSDVIKLPAVRLSFPKLWTPSAFREGQQARYEAAFLLDPSDKAHAKVIKQIVSTAQALLEEEFNGEIPDSVECCFGFSDAREIKIGTLEWRGKKKSYDGYEGMFFITSSNSKIRPTVVDRDRSPLVEADGRPYAGSFVNGTITLWIQDNEFGKRVNANLRGVQFVRDGDAFGVKPVDADDEFDVVDVDDFDDDDDFDLD